MCARRFLVLIFILTVLAVAAAFAIFQFGQDVLVKSATPSGAFEQPAADSGPDYSSLENWIAHPDKAGDPSQWQPGGGEIAPSARPAHLFFVHPTTYLQRARWNAPLDDRQSNLTADLFVKSQASAFGTVAHVWAPRYRQAAYGAFLLDSPDARQALDLAYDDVSRAFDRFIEQVPADAPIILAGHSQGSLHLVRLLSRVAPRLGDRLIAAYVAGWPVGAKADLAPMGLAPCVRPDQRGCVLSWQSFAEPANPDLVLESWVGSRGASGIVRERSDMVCVNPLTGSLGGSAPPAANPGTLVPTGDLQDASLLAGKVGARCDRGFLLIGGDIPDLGPFVLPGNNYHVYDYALFWAAIRRDIQRRTGQWSQR